MATDKEIKFIASANTQIKFYNKNVDGEIYQKTKKLIHFLGLEIVREIEADTEESPTRNDIYFDQDWLLARRNCSLSIRSYSSEDQEIPGGKNILTLKFNENKDNIANDVTVLLRKEENIDLNEKQYTSLLKNGITSNTFKDLFPNVGIAVPARKCFVDQGHAKVRRSLFDVATDSSTYQVSIDRFYFLNPRLNRYSETYTEIEVENTCKTEPNGSIYHEKILEFVQLLRIMFDVKNEPKSKYQRFRDFSIQDDFKARYFLGWDIISYSTEYSWTQKQIVQRFHKIIKDSISASGFLSREECLSISIGDGAIIATETNWGNIEALIKKVYEGVKENNKNGELRQISYRAGLHWGSVFPFTDLNDSINIAGEGINTVSRLCSIGDPWQVRASKQAYEQIINSSPSSASDFGPMQEEIVKHGVPLQIRLYTGLDKE